MSLEDKISDNGSEGPDIGTKLNDAPTSFGSALKRISFWEWAKIAFVNASSALASGASFFYGALNVFTTTASFITANYLLNRKNGFTKKGIQTDLNLGGPYTYVTYKLFQILSAISNPMLWAGAYAAALIPFTAVTNALKYHIEKYSPLTYVKGLFKAEFVKDIGYIAKDAITGSVKSGARAAKWLTFPVTASRYLFPEELLIASLYPIRAAYRYLIGRNPEDKPAGYASIRYAPQAA